MRKIKKFALQAILLCMEEMRSYLQAEYSEDDKKKDAEIILILAEAFQKINSPKGR